MEQVDLAAENALLKAKIAQLEKGVVTVRQKIEAMSSEVVDSNPYRYRDTLTCNDLAAA